MNRQFPRRKPLFARGRAAALGADSWALTRDALARLGRNGQRSANGCHEAALCFSFAIFFVAFAGGHPMMSVSKEPPELSSSDEASQRREKEEALRKGLIESSQERSRWHAEVKKKDPFMYFCYCVGWAIQKWATIDHDIFSLFRFALNARNDVKAARLYYRSQAISDRFQMVDTLMQLDLNKKQLRAWSDFQQEFNRLSAFRNRLVHDPVNAVIRFGDTGEIVEEFNEINIEKAKLLRALNKPKPAPIRLKDIQEHSHDLVKLQFKIVAFILLLPKRAQKRLQVPPSIPSRLKSQQSQETARKRAPKTRRRRRRPQS
jgi:hypothetical protein